MAAEGTTESLPEDFSDVVAVVKNVFVGY